MPSERNKRIARNTAILYVRMLMTIAVNLYTMRVVWQVLGVDDYGIYNLVGGIVLTFAFLNSAMVASSQRFIAFELGQGDEKRLNKVFCIAVTVHLMLALAVLLLAETAGLWFLNDRLHIPPGRMGAANWVFQCSVAAFCVNIISVPYNACIVAYEHIKAYGYMSILEVLLKLLIVFLLMALPGDKLVVYALLVLAVSVLMRVLYQIYCRRHFPATRMRRVSDRHLMRDMFAFAGWSFIGNFGFSVRDQGINFILNLFFDVAVNAAKGVANSVANTINGFSSNLQMALNPQITKRYAAGETDSMLRLMMAGSRYSFLLLSLIVVPAVIAMERIIAIWLGSVAPYTVSFSRLMLMMGLVDSMAGPVTAALQATGRIRNFQIAISVIMLLNLPLAWLWLHFDPYPPLVVVVGIAMSAIGLGARLMLLHAQLTFSYRRYLTGVVARVVPTLLISGAASWWFYGLLPHTLWGLVAYGLVSVVVSALVTMAVGLDANERTMIAATLKKKLHISH